MMFRDFEHTQAARAMQEKRAGGGLSIEFTVFGKPEPQGSARAMTYKRKDGKGTVARVFTANPNLQAWREVVAWEARRVYQGVPFKGPVKILAAFYLTRPKKLKRTAHTVKPDIDKLARGIFDALSKVIYVDDAQVTQLNVTKQYAALGHKTGAIIRVESIDARPLLAADRNGA